MASPFDALAPVLSIHRAASSGIRPGYDTFPADGVGGVRGTGEGQEFFVGGYASSGCCGAVPLGRQALTVGPAQPSSFFSALSADLLAAMEAKGSGTLEEPSPKSVVGGLEFEEAVVVNARLADDQTAWQERCATD